MCFESGSFTIGCNYWASHAGTAMWREWKEEVIRSDFEKLAALGLEVIRVFPLWPDFQPLELLCTERNRPYEITMADGKTPPDTPAGRAGMDSVMLERFRRLADIAADLDLRLVVGLITGWMSGRMFAPEAFTNRNLLTDPLVIRWQTRFVRCFVDAMKDHPAIIAWEPGNECNCLGEADRHASWLWCNTISSAIRSADPTRPVMAGMHSLVPAADRRFEGKAWTIGDMGELFDVLTTHPYPIFTPHAARDPLTGFRNAFHAACESRFYADIGGRPCFAEEIGSLNSMVAGESEKCRYLRMALFNLWAHDCPGFLWWCAFDQLHLQHPPYDWHAVERELGLFRNDGKAKPAAAELTGFARFLRSLPFDRLPHFRRNAVCLLSGNQDAWGNAWSAWLLAKQAGFDLEFQYWSEPLRDADLYLVPGLCGQDGVNRSLWFELLRRADAGATVSLSIDTALLSPFDDALGVQSHSREQRSGIARLRLGESELPIGYETRLNLEPAGAEQLAADTDGNACFFRRTCGSGELFLLTLPLERYLAENAGVFSAPEKMPYHSLYRRIAARALQKRAVHSPDPLVTVTEHGDGPQPDIAVLVNHHPDTIRLRPELAPGLRISEILRGRFADDNGTLEINGSDGAVLLLASEADRNGGR